MRSDSSQRLPRANQLQQVQEMRPGQAGDLGQEQVGPTRASPAYAELPCGSTPPDSCLFMMYLISLSSLLKVQLVSYQLNFLF